ALHGPRRALQLPLGVADGDRRRPRLLPVGDRDVVPGARGLLTSLLSARLQSGSFNSGRRVGGTGRFRGCRDLLRVAPTLAELRFELRELVVDLAALRDLLELPVDVVVG